MYCGSKEGRDPAYAEAARSVGALLAGRGIRLVYGGGSIGLMDLVAQAALDAGGEVVGVIPRKLMDLEVGKEACTELHVVSDMHARKRMMADLADGFVALPGGYGTLEELFEAVTLTQLGYHRKPVGLLDVGGYYQPLVALFDHMVAHGFVTESQRKLVEVCDDAVILLDRLG